jgi:hypothetical protein
MKEVNVSIFLCQNDLFCEKGQKYLSNLMKTKEAQTKNKRVK